jgi:hypothetical protein
MNMQIKEIVRDIVICLGSGLVSALIVIQFIQINVVH